jgi:hypothetical protein
LTTSSPYIIIILLGEIPSLHFRNREKLMITHPTFTNYIIFRDGTIMNKTNGKVLKPQTNKKGYLVVNLQKDKKAHKKGVNRLVMETYRPIDNPHLYHAHHIDGVRHHNHIGNLRWELIEDHMREHKKGKVLTEEHRRKLSESQKGRVFSAEHRKKLSESQKGHLVSDETRKKLSEANKGKVLTEEHKRKMSESLKGHLVSDETRKKLSEANKGKPNKGLVGKGWWNNGTRNIRSKTHPGDGWARGMM